MAQPSEASQSRPPQPEGNSQDDKPRSPEEQLQPEHRKQQPSTNHPPGLPAESTVTYRSARPPHDGGVEHGTGGDRGEDERENKNGHVWPAARSDDSNTGLLRTSSDGSADSTDVALHNGQHGTRHLGDAPPSTSPPMSNPQHPAGPHRPQVSYPNAAFQGGIPSGPPQYASYPQHPNHGDMYRASAAATVNSSMALPSMRTLDPMQSQQQQPQHGMTMAPPMGGPMGPGGPQMPYYGVGPPYGMADQMRFALPGMGADPRIALSGGRHKKEIKRRTKTGCLTCRKRRIKCDEAHPTCNNCKKSKRECLGYDPIFKQAPGPAAIQPAPNSQSPTAPTLGSSSTPNLPSSNTNQYRPPVVLSSYPAQGQSSTTTLESSLSPTSQGSKTEGGFEYAPAIDPALQSNSASPTIGAPSLHYRDAKSDSLEHQSAGLSNQFRGGPLQ